MSLIYQRIRKQDLLLDAILYKKLDKEKLIAYLSQLRGEEYQFIDLWGQQELEQAIEEFAQSQQMEQGHQINQELMHKEVIKCKQVPGDVIVGYLKQNPTLILEPTIPEYQIVDEGMFSAKFVNYKICLEGLDTTVWRRLEYFYWLADILAIQYPDSLIPPLPAKTIIKKFTPEHLSKRCKMLSQFLSAILSNQLLRQSNYVEAFLTQEDDTKFKQVMTASSSVKTPSKFQDYQNIEGQILCEYSPQMNTFFNEMTNYLGQTNEVYKEMTDNSRIVADSVKDLQDKVKKLELNVGQMKDLTKTFNSKTFLGTIPLQECVYTLLQEYLISWGDNLTKIQNTMTENFYEFFRFQRDMQQKCSELIVSRNTAFNKFNKEYQELQKKKMKVFTTIPYEKWDLAPNDYDKVKLCQNKDLALPLMFPKDSAVVHDLRNKYGYANRQSFEQIHQYFDHKSILYMSRMKNMSLDKKAYVEAHYQHIEKVYSQLDQLQKMRNGVFEGLELRQEWMSAFFTPYMVDHILSVQ